MKRIVFDIDGDRLVGDLHLPDGDGPHPAVVMAGPMTSVKEQVTGTYAAALANQGFAALSIDHRHFGESEGTPRQYEFYEHKIEDLRAALDVLGNQSEVDARRIGAVGVCLGSGYLAHAINERSDVKALVAVAGYFRDVEALKAADPDDFPRKVDQGRHARERYERAGVVEMIPAVALDRDAAMTMETTYDYYARRATHPNYTNELAVMSREHFLSFDVQSAAPEVAVPVLMVHGLNALNPDWADKFFSAVRSTKSRATICSKGQTDIYDDPIIVKQVTSLAAEFLSQHL
ncbi:MAG: alpha/beta hydrolase [Pseudomonadota bacterium]